MHKLFILLSMMAFVAACETTQSEDEEQGGGERVEAPAADDAGQVG